MSALLLTGASGYLGSRVEACLLRHGAAFDVLSGRLQDIAPASLPYRYVIHCAGKTSRSREADLFAANALGTECLLKGLGADARVVFVSSRKVYPQLADVCIDESQAPAPWDHYGAGKLEAERLLRSSGREFVIFRAGAMFGHSSQIGKFPDLALQAALAGDTITLATPARREDYLDVNLLAEMMVQACAAGSHWGHVFNVSGPVRELDDILKALNRACLEVLAAPITVRYSELPIPRFPWLDVRKLQAYFPDLRQLDDQQIFCRMLRARLMGGG